MDIEEYEYIPQKKKKYKSKFKKDFRRKGRNVIILK